MKTAIAIILAILCVEIGISIFYQHEDSQKIFSALAEIKREPVKWEYKVEACDDDSNEMSEYAKTHPGLSGEDFRGKFDLMKIQPDAADANGTTDWELCAWFLEPTTVHPQLILIFKRPAQ